MRRRIAIVRWAGIACLGLAALVASILAWPSSRERIDLSLLGDQILSGWVKPGSSAGAPDASSVPSLTLSIELPRSVLLGREEALGLVVNVSSEGTGTAVYSLEAQVVSVGADVAPPGESGQALGDGATFEWTMVAKCTPSASATLIVRLRRHSPQGVTEAERLVLARDIALPVRAVAGLSAPGARVVAAVLGLGGAILGIASALTRTR